MREWLRQKNAHTMYYECSQFTSRRRRADQKSQSLMHKNYVA